MKLLAALLHCANTSPPWLRDEFYDLKKRLLLKYAEPDGEDIQLIEHRYRCWGPYNHRTAKWDGCGVGGCRRCGGTGIFRRSWQWHLLKRFTWHGYSFHVPEEMYSMSLANRITIRGKIKHAAYGLRAREAALWLYLLCGEWRLLWRALTTGHVCYPRFWPMLRLQKICSVSLTWLARHQWFRYCHCGRLFVRWRRADWQCAECRRVPVNDDVPF